MTQTLRRLALIAFVLAGCSGKMPTSQGIGSCGNDPCATMVCPQGNHCRVSGCAPACEADYPTPFPFK